MFIFYSKFGDAKDKSGIGQDPNQKVTEHYYKRLEEWGKATGQGQSYFDMINNAKTWGDVKKGFTDLKLNFQSFLTWYEQQRLAELNSHRAKFTSHGSAKSVGAMAAIHETEENKRKEIAERTDDLKPKEGRSNHGFFT